MPTRSIALLVTAIIVFAGHGKAYAQESLILTVVVSGATPGKGQAIGSLFDSKESYLKKPAQETIVVIDATGRATFTFEGLAAQTYAVSVIYDEDSVGELDTGLFGIPKELIAMSNNAKGRFGPPSFNKTKFDLHSNKTIEIRFGKAKE